MQSHDDVRIERTPILRAVEAIVRLATAQFPLLACATPLEASAEQARLEAAWRSGVEASPAWVPPPLDRAALARVRRGVDQARADLARSSRLEQAERPWTSLHRARLDELAHELALVDGAFSAAVIGAARARFVVPADEATEADRVAAAWLDDPERERPREAAPAIATDDDADPRSLLSSMRAAVHARGFPVRVVVRDRIGVLAATGDGVVIVARGRRASPRDVARVVLHEVEGHVAPRVRGRAHPLLLATLGSAGASEDEEGRALVLESRADALDPARRAVLAARHVAARAVDEGASFVEVVRAGLGRGLVVEDALAIAARVMRGGFVERGDVFGGLARERVYLPAFVRVSRAIARGEASLEGLGHARLSLAALRTLGMGSRSFGSPLSSPPDRR